jgi:hypothetical protein
MFKNIFFLFFVIAFFFSCSELERKTEKELAQEKFGDIPFVEYKPSPNPDKNAYFGDLHVHTENSFDAYTFGTTSSPADAYEFAKGKAIKHPTGYAIQLSRPLDFYAVTDHGVFMGIVKEAADTSSEVSKYELAKPLHNLNENVSGSIISILRRANTFRPFARSLATGIEEGIIDMELLQKVSNGVWQRTVEAADQAYVPGEFTSFAAYEYTSSVEIHDNYLHRNVIFRDTKNLPKNSLPELIV